MPTELHNVPRTVKGTWVKLVNHEEGPPGAGMWQAGDLILFYHVDGMYSTCTDRAGNPVYLKAWAEVEVIGEDI